MSASAFRWTISAPATRRLRRSTRLPLDRIKIDKSFISTIVKSEQTAAIVNTIASLGHTLSVPITAEGVESEQVRNELKQIRLFAGSGLAVRPGHLRRYRAQLPRDEGRPVGRRAAGGRAGADAAPAEPPLVEPNGRPARRGHPHHRQAPACRRCCPAANSGKSDNPSRPGKCASDMGRRRPHHLCVVSDVFPVAAGADRREDAGAQVALFRRPHADQLLRAQRAVTGPCQVLALAGTSSAAANGRAGGGARASARRSPRDAASAGSQTSGGWPSAARSRFCAASSRWRARRSRCRPGRRTGRSGRRPPTRQRQPPSRLRQ